MYVSNYEYIIYSYGDHSAVALASITMVRYLVAGGMVMAARPMYEAIGVNWTMTISGVHCLFLTPAPLLFWWKGADLRERSRYAQRPSTTQSTLGALEKEVYLTFGDLPVTYGSE